MKIPKDFCECSKELLGQSANYILEPCESAGSERIRTMIGKPVTVAIHPEVVNAMAAGAKALSTRKGYKVKLTDIIRQTIYRRFPIPEDSDFLSKGGPTVEG